MINKLHNQYLSNIVPYVHKHENNYCILCVLQPLCSKTKPDVQNNDSEWQNIYKGMLAPRIRNLKIVSFVTSSVGLLVQPMVIQKAAEVGSSLAATIGVCTIAGFFTFITPVLIHLVSRKYVTSLEYSKRNDEYCATVFSFFIRPKKASICNQINRSLITTFTTYLYLVSIL